MTYNARPCMGTEGQVFEMRWDHLMKTIYYDDSSGSLKHGRVWEASWGDKIHEVGKDVFVYAVFVKDHGGQEVPLCFRGPRHQRTFKVDSVDVDLFGSKPGHFVSLFGHGFNLVIEPFAKRLKESGLNGFSFRDVVRVAENQSGWAEPKLTLFDNFGRGGFCHRYKIQGAPNLCPHCRGSQIICDYCGTIFSKCPSCGRPLVSDEKDSKDPNCLRFEGFPKTLIVSNRDWDGSDIFAVDGPGGGVFFSQRAKDWFEKSHVFEVKFKTAYLDVS